MHIRKSHQHYSHTSLILRLLTVSLAVLALELLSTSIWAQKPSNPKANDMMAMGSLNEYQATIIARMEAREFDLKLVKKATSVKLSIKGADGKTRTVKYVLDCGDPNTGIAFEFVSRFDCQAVYGKKTKVTPAQLASTIKAAIAAAKKSDRTMIVVEDTKGDYGKQSVKLRSDLKSFFSKLKKQGILR